jgi:copper chaperone
MPTLPFKAPPRAEPDTSLALHMKDEPMSTTATIQVTGMTCQHCVNAVTEEVTALDSVTRVEIELHPEAVSLVTVTSDAPLDLANVVAAIDEAGYELAENGSQS